MNCQWSHSFHVPPPHTNPPGRPDHSSNPGYTIELHTLTLATYSYALLVFIIASWQQNDWSTLSLVVFTPSYTVQFTSIQWAKLIQFMFLFTSHCSTAPSDLSESARWRLLNSNAFQQAVKHIQKEKVKGVRGDKHFPKSKGILVIVWKLFR